MKNIINSQKNITVLTEFWPKGILQAGSNPKYFLKMLRKMRFELFELKQNGSLILLKHDNDNEFIEKYKGRRYTNIVGKKLTQK